MGPTCDDHESSTFNFNVPMMDSTPECVMVVLGLDVTYFLGRTTAAKKKKKKTRGRSTIDGGGLR